MCSPHDLDQYEGLWERAMKELEVDAAKWRSRWPCHCRACGGWGGKMFEENHGLPGPGDQLFDVCHHCVGAEKPRCGRCSFPMFEAQVELGAPCAACGWFCDDGEPML